MDANGVVYLKNMGIGIQYTMRISRWSKNNVMDRLFEVLQKNNMVKVECLGLDSTFVKVHPDGTEVLKKWSTIYWKVSWRMDNQNSYGVTQNDRSALNFSLSPGNKNDADEGCILLSSLQDCNEQFKGIPLVMDRAYEGGKTRKSLINMGFNPVVPPKSNRLNPWNYNRKTYKKEMKLNVY